MRLTKLLIGSMVAVSALWVGNTSRFASIPMDSRPQVIAHRGVSHVYAGDNRSATTCRAPEVELIVHEFIENTIPSMRAAFEYGADVVELDVHVTRDGAVAVFHDWTLNCQTNGQGVTHDKTLAELKVLDLGFGISDDATHYPLRGKGIGLLPSLDEVFAAELNGRYLINFKSDIASEGDVVAALIHNSDAQARVFAVYGGAAPTSTAMVGADLIGFDKTGLKRCLGEYVFLGWSGYVPKACRTGLIAVPMTFAPFLWGWPHRFTDRMHAAGTEVILWGPYDGSGFSSGIDDAETLAKVPEHFGGYIWTNKIEDIGPALKRH